MKNHIVVASKQTAMVVVFAQDDNIIRVTENSIIPGFHRHYKIFCVNVKYGIQYGFRIFYLIALQNEENYEREESCSA